MKAVLASYTLRLSRFSFLYQRLDGRSLRHAPRLCLRHRRLHARLFSLRNFQQHPTSLSPVASCLGCAVAAMMVPVGRLTMVRTFAKSELIRAMSFVAIPGLIGPVLRTDYSVAA